MTISKNISKKRVKEIIAAYGGNPKNWPEDERIAAKELVNIFKDLQQEQSAALKLDTKINHAPKAKIDTALTRQIIASALSHSQETAITQKHIKSKELPTSWKHPKWFWLPSGIGAAIAASIIGFFAGTGQLPLNFTSKTTDTTPIAQEEILTEEMIIFSTASFEEWEL